MEAGLSTTERLWTLQPLARSRREMGSQIEQLREASRETDRHLHLRARRSLSSSRRTAARSDAAGRRRAVATRIRDIEAVTPRLSGRLWLPRDCLAGRWPVQAEKSTSGPRSLEALEFSTLTWVLPLTINAVLPPPLPRPSPHFLRQSCGRRPHAYLSHIYYRAK